MLDRKTWVYGYLESKDYIHTSKGASIQVIPETVGQFTGLLDERKNEVYEGDILRVWHNKETGDVKFENGCFRYKEHPLCWHGDIEGLQFDGKIIGAEIIGSTHTEVTDKIEK